LFKITKAFSGLERKADYAGLTGKTLSFSGIGQKTGKKFHITMSGMYMKTGKRDYG
jgi:hypothetical protein